MLDTLRQQLHTDLEAGARWCVALSGGVDSTALLHGLTQLVRATGNNRIRAVHINHHLHARADAWATACSRLCADLGVDLACRDVAVEADGADGLEAAARRARYAAFDALLEDGEILVTAHHRDDQAETVLLRLLRGAGPHGLAGIPTRRRFGRGWLVRPLLTADRAVLAAYAREQQLAWVDDPANADTAFDRNYLRHRVLPVLRARWPGLAETIPRAARLSGEAVCLLDELAEIDAETACRDGTISVTALARLSRGRRHNLVRHVLKGCGLLPPGEARLREGLGQLLTAGPDRLPALTWPGGQIRRYRGRLYVLDFDPAPTDVPPSAEYRWDGSGRLDLGPLAGRLRFMRRDGMAVNVPGDWSVRFRAGGERIEAGSRHKTIKNLFQERGVVPWMRPHVPLLYRAARLVAVGDLWQADDCEAGIPAGDVRVTWDRHPPVV